MCQLLYPFMQFRRAQASLFCFQCRVKGENKLLPVVFREIGFDLEQYKEE